MTRVKCKYHRTGCEAGVMAYVGDCDDIYRCLRNRYAERRCYEVKEKRVRENITEAQLTSNAPH